MGVEVVIYLKKLYEECHYIQLHNKGQRQNTVDF